MGCEEKSYGDATNGQYQCGERGNHPPPVKSAGDRSCDNQNRISLCVVFGRNTCDRGQKTVTSARNGLHESGLFGRVAQGIAEAPDCGVQAVVEIDKSVGWPESLAYLFARHDLSRTFQK